MFFTCISALRANVERPNDIRRSTFGVRHSVFDIQLFDIRTFDIRPFFGIWHSAVRHSAFLHWNVRHFDVVPVFHSNEQNQVSGYSTFVWEFTTFFTPYTLAEFEPAIGSSLRGCDETLPGNRSAVCSLSGEALFREKCRVARFFMIEHTKTVKIYQITITCTKSL
jgi:hypothetical protein